MSVEVRPLGVRCNIACDYCYQQPQRDAGTDSKTYDLELMKQAVEEEGGPFTLFGGEPLLLPKRDLEDLWAWGFEKYGRNTVQTNGVLINEEHIRMFRQYNVTVGISIDGPGALNDVRWAGSLEKTRAATAKTEAAISRLCQENLAPCLIVTVHQENAGPQKLPILREWLRSLDRLGIPFTRIHLLESEEPWIRERYGMSMEDNIRVLLDIASLEPELRSMKLDIFHEVEQLLQGQQKGVSCIWRACDPYTTPAVRGVEGMGQRSNCGRTNKDGVEFVKADEPGYERYIGLYRTPMEAGGCQGCRFFLMCKGQCPGTAIDGDWRNRTEHCDIWMQLFEHAEKNLMARDILPLSLHPDREAQELALVEAWARKDNPNLEALTELAGKKAPSRSATGPAPEASGPSSEAAGATSDVWSRVAAVERLDFTMPAYRRVAWASTAARREWEPVLGEIARLLPRIFGHAIRSGLYPCAVVRVRTPDLDALEAFLRDELGLVIATLGESGEAADCVIGEADSVARFLAAKEEGRRDTLFSLLGTPSCCQAFRSEAEGHGFSDLTLPRALNTADTQVVGETILVPSSTDLLSTLLFPLGIRPVSHAPCSLTCRASREQASAWLEIGRAEGLEKVVESIEEMLTWPVEWSALHGSAEIKTPILRLSTNTDATARKSQIRILSDRLPAEMPSGVRFPYAPPSLVTLGAAPSKPAPKSHAAKEAAACGPPADSRKTRKRPVKTLAPRPRSSAILDQTFARIRQRSGNGLVPIESIYSSSHFNAIRLEDGSVGAAMSYCKFKSDEAAARCSRELEARLESDPSLLDYLFSDEEPDLLQLSLKTCLVSAYSQSLLLDPPELTVRSKFDAAFLPDVDSAVVIGFGGYMHYLIAHSNTPRVHISDLGYRTRFRRMDAAMAYYREKYPDKELTVSDGSDTRERLAAADLVSITGSAFCSGTMDELLDAARDCRTVVVQGQSASIWPEVLFEHGVDTVSTTLKPPELVDLARTDPEEFRALLEGKLRFVYFGPGPESVVQQTEEPPCPTPTCTPETHTTTSTASMADIRRLRRNTAPPTTS